VVTWTDLFERTAREVVAGNCLGLAAQLAYCFFLVLSDRLSWRPARSDRAEIPIS
jgi:hypothetical protein